jgi:hypothetical protein
VIPTPETRERAGDLAQALIDIVEERGNGLPIEMVIAASLEIVAFYVGTSPPASREQMLAGFQEHLLDSLESRIDDFANEHHRQMPLPLSS